MGLDTRNRYRSRHQHKEKTINSFKLIIEASEAITNWHRGYHGNCVLSILNGKVICSKPLAESHLAVKDLYVTVWYMEHGFNQVQWNSIATELLNLYNKEKACQARQKP